MYKKSLLIFSILFLVLALNVYGAECDATQSDLGSCPCSLSSDIILNPSISYNLSCNGSALGLIDFNSNSLDGNGSTLILDDTAPPDVTHYLLDNNPYINNITLVIYNTNGGSTYLGDYGGTTTINNSLIIFNTSTDGFDSTKIYNSNVTSNNNLIGTFIKDDSEFYNSNFYDIYSTNFKTGAYELISDNCNYKNIDNSNYATFNINNDLYFNFTNNVFELNADQDDEPIIRFTSISSTPIYIINNTFTVIGSVGAGDDAIEIVDTSPTGNILEVYNNNFYTGFYSTFGWYEGGAGGGVSFNVSSIDGNWYNTSCVSTDGINCDNVQNVTESTDLIGLDYNAYAIPNGWESASPEGDTTNPTVTLNSPIDNQNITISNVIFNCSASDNIKLDNVSLYINGILNETNTSGINNTNYIFNKTLADGDYNWTCRAYDNSSNVFEAVNFTLNINTVSLDTTPPTISYSNQSINNNTVLSYQSTVSDDVAIDSCWFNDTSLYNVNNSGYIYNTSSITTLGTTHLNYSCNDTSNNIKSVIFSVTVQDPDNNELLIFLIPETQTYTNPYYTFKKNSPIDITIICLDNNNAFCNSNIFCNISINYPNSSILVNNQQLTHMGSYYKYNFTELPQNGIYPTTVTCYGYGNAYTTFSFKITPNGEDPTTSQSLFYIVNLTLLILLLGGSIFGLIKSEALWSKYAYLVLSYILMIAISFVSWNMANNFITSSSFLVWFLRFMFLFLMWSLLPFILCSFIYSLYYYKNIKAIQNLINKGIPESEAIKRTKNK